MPEPIRYFTLSGEPPNGAVPPGRMFAAVVGLQGVDGQDPTSTQQVNPPAAQASTPYEPPGQYVAGENLRGDDWSYIAPTEHTTIYFVGDGVRPCDSPNGQYPYAFNYSKHKIPCIMTVKEMMERLGCPAGDQYGVTEMEEQGNNVFRAGLTITQGSEFAARTLAEVGWTEMRGLTKPIWIVVKR